MPLNRVIRRAKQGRIAQKDKSNFNRRIETMWEQTLESKLCEISQEALNRRFPPLGKVVIPYRKIV